MKLYWSPRSPFVRKVMVCVHEMGIAERIEKVYALVSMSKVNMEVLPVNPIGRIPVLIDDDGRVLSDSAVICEYLDAIYGDSRLFPKQKPQRWDALRRHALGDGMLETGVLWRGEQSRPKTQQSADILAGFEQKITSALAALEYETDAYVRSDVDIGHIAIACALGYLDFRFGEIEWRKRAPLASQWFDRFATRTSMRETLPYEEQ